MNLTKAEEGVKYLIKEINTDDEEFNSFLFSLGCYSGEPIKVVSKKRSGSIVEIKGGKYSFDKALCEAISVIENL